MPESVKQGRIEANFTAVPNSILDGLLRLGCSGGEMAIVLAVIRFTLGFRRESRRLSLTYLAKATGRHRNKIFTDLRSLIGKRVLREKSPPRGIRPRVIAINTSVDEWVSAFPVTVTESTDSTVTAGSDSTVSASSEQERKEERYTKRKAEKRSVRHFPKAGVESLAAELYDYYATRVRAGARTDAVRSITKLLKATAEDGSHPYSSELLRSCIDRYLSNGISPDKQFRLQCNTFFGRAERFKDYFRGATPEKATSFSPLEHERQQQRLLADGVEHEQANKR